MSWRSIDIKMEAYLKSYVVKVGSVYRGNSYPSTVLSFLDHRASRSFNFAPPSLFLFFDCTFLLSLVCCLFDFQAANALRFFQSDSSVTSHHEILGAFGNFCPGGNSERSYYGLEHLCQWCQPGCWELGCWIYPYPAQQ